MKPNKMTGIRFFKICVYTILAVTTLYFVLWQAAAKPNDPIDNNIQILDGFETTDANGNTVTVQTGQRYAFIGDVFEMRNTLPEGTGDKYLCFLSFCDTEIYCGEREIYRNSLFDGNEVHIAGGAVKPIHHLAKLDESCSGQTVRIVQHKGPEETCQAAEVMIGTGSEIYRLMFKKYGSLFVMALFILVVAAVVLIFGLAMQHRTKQPAGIVTICVAIIVTAAWIMTESYFYPFVFLRSHIDGLMSYFMCMILPSPYIFYLAGLQKGRYRKTYLIAHSIVLGSFVVLTGLHFSGLCRFYRSLPYIDYMLGGTIIALGVIMFREFRMGYVRTYRNTAIGLICFMLSGFGEILIILISNPENTGGLLMAGVMLLLGFAIAQQMEDSRKAELERQRALELSHTKTTFLANMSHEIRTPINSILGMNEMILRESKEPETLAYAGTIRRSGRMLLSLINDVLDFSRIETGRLEIVQEEYRLNELLTDVCSIAGEQAEQKGLAFELKIAEGIPVGMVSDEVRIKQVLLNLLSNAVKYTDRGGVTLSVNGQYTDTETFRLVFSVRDTGRGIRKEDLGQLFEAFTRKDLQKNRNIEGTGLGLAIVKSITDGLGGTVSVESEYQKGSVFTVSLPQKVTDRSNMPLTMSGIKEAAVGNAPERTYTSPDSKILAVDDNQPNLSIVRAFLKDTKARVDLCTDGNQALTMCRREQYDLILLDHMMPDPDGIQTLKMIREDPQGKNRETKALVLTANAVAGIRQTYLNAGFADYLSKPLTVEALQHAVRKHLPADKVHENGKTAGNADEVMEFEACPDDFPDSAGADTIPNIPGLDPEEALLHTGGSVQLLMEILGDVAEGAGKTASEIRRSAARIDMESYRLCCHTVKSLTATIGAREMSDTARIHHENAAREKNEMFIREHHEEFARAYETLGEEIHRRITEF